LLRGRLRDDRGEEDSVGTKRTRRQRTYFHVDLRNVADNVAVIVEDREG